MTRSRFITATIAVVAASAAVLVAFDEASARSFRGAGASRGGHARAVSQRAAMPRMGRARTASPRMGRIGRTASPRASRMASPRAGRFAAPRARHVPQRGRQASRLSRPISQRAGQLRRPGNTLARANAGRFDPRMRRPSVQPMSQRRLNNTRANPLSSRQANAGRPDPRRAGQTLPRPNLGQFDQARNAASNRGANSQPKPTPMASNKAGRFYNNMGGSSTPANQNATPKPQATPNTPPSRQPKDESHHRNPAPNAGQQILIDWRNSFVKGVRGGVTYNVNSAGTAFSVCQNMATLCAGGSVPLAGWLLAPAPGWGSTLFDGFVTSFTPTDPNDPLSTPFDNAVRDAATGAQHFDLNPFDNLANPPAAWGK